MKKNRKKTNTMNTVQTQQSVKKKEEKTEQRRVNPAIWDMIDPNAAGIDVHSEQMWVCVPADRAERHVRQFGAYTDDLYASADFLSRCGIASVAMESTGVYWIPLYQVLEERGFSVCFTNARHLKGIAGRPKTDKLDCQWIQRVHSDGFLKPSCRPDDEMCRIRAIQRHRKTLVHEASRHIHHRQKALDQMNLTLSKVLTDITGVSGMSIIEHLLKGARHPKFLATFRDHRCTCSEDEMAKALTGDSREEHVCVLGQALDGYRCVQTQLQRGDREIEARLKTIDTQVDASQTPPPVRVKKGTSRTPKTMTCDSDGRTVLYACFGTDVTTLPGIDVSNGCGRFGELGSDLRAWKHGSCCVSW